MLTADHGFAGLDKELCEVTSVILDATELTQSTGVWTQNNGQSSQGVQILEATNPKSKIEGLEPGNTYTFIWTISQGICADFASDEMTLTIDDIPPDNALIPKEVIFLCEEDQLILNAQTPAFSAGNWLGQLHRYHCRTQRTQVLLQKI